MTPENAPPMRFPDDPMDITVYDSILSQTSAADRRALLGVRRAVAAAGHPYSYLEIGSYRGGSLLPYLHDPLCTQIYSVDLRLSDAVPDAREQRITFSGNSTEAMLGRLRAIDPKAARKITCFESSASEIDRRQIKKPPMIAFIDAEHTDDAVRSDYAVCREIVAENGVILFHDFQIVWRGILDCVRQEPATVSAFRIEHTVFGVFLDPGLVSGDPYLSARRRANWAFHRLYPLRKRVANAIVHPTRRWLRGVRGA